MRRRGSGAEGARRLSGESKIVSPPKGRDSADCGADRRGLRLPPVDVPQCGILSAMGEAAEIAVLQLPKFKASATKVIGAAGIEAVAIYLSGYPDAGAVIPGAGGARKLRWAASGRGKRGGARIVYLYLAIAARVYLLQCYAKNVQPDLTADEKRQLRQIAARLKGVQ